MSDDMSWISGLSLLKFLDLSNADLSKAQNHDIVFYMMPSLVELSLSACGLTNADLGTLSNSSTTLANIKHPDLGYNHFIAKGAFPADSFGRMTNLRGLRLSFNRLTGLIPGTLGRLRLLEELYLSNNQLTGPIPTFIRKLTTLDLSSNRLNGLIPESIGRLDSLQVFLVYSNTLNGTVPVSIGQLTKLRDLDISKKSLEGVISEAHFAKLLMLKHLDTSSNSKLTFNVSREWKPPFQLITADLSSSKSINGFPQWLRTQKKIRDLRLSNATITGPLPTWLQKMPIALLDLSHNKLSGPVTNLPNEGYVDSLAGYSKALCLQDNLFNESIPISL
ncbi:leucine-rich repeat protein [Tanacetum coccineum]